MRFLLARRLLLRLERCSLVLLRVLQILTGTGTDAECCRRAPPEMAVATAAAQAEVMLAGAVRGAGLLSSFQRRHHQVVEHATGLTAHHHCGLAARVNVADQVAPGCGRTGHGASGGSYPQRVHDDFEIFLVLVALVRELERNVQVRQRVKGMMMVVVMMVMVVVETVVQEIYFGTLGVDGRRGIGTQQVRGAVIDSGEESVARQVELRQRFPHQAIVVLVVHLGVLALPRYHGLFQLFGTLGDFRIDQWHRGVQRTQLSVQRFQVSLHRGGSLFGCFDFFRFVIINTATVIVVVVVILAHELVYPQLMVAAV